LIIRKAHGKDAGNEEKIKNHNLMSLMFSTAIQRPFIA